MRPTLEITVGTGMPLYCHTQYQAESRRFRPLPPIDAVLVASVSGNPDPWRWIPFSKLNCTEKASVVKRSFLVALSVTTRAVSCKLLVETFGIEYPSDARNVVPK